MSPHVQAFLRKAQYNFPGHDQEVRWSNVRCRARHSHNGVGVQEAEAARDVECHPPALLHPAAHAAALPLQRAPQIAALHILHHQHRPVPTHARPLAVSQSVSPVPSHMGLMRCHDAITWPANQPFNHDISLKHRRSAPALDIKYEPRWEDCW